MIGRAFGDDRRNGAIALAIALAVVALQYQDALLAHPWAQHQGGTHLIVVLGAILVMWRLASRDFDTLGLRVRVEPSWRFWVVAAALIALVVGVVGAGYVLATGKFEHAGPDNFIAGYFLAWAYLRSGSVTVPIALHAAGNLIGVLVHPQF